MKIVFLLLGLAAYAEAAVTEIKSMREILPHVTNETLLVFDLDNTLIEPAESYGSDQWFEAMVDALGKKGKPEPAAVDEILPLWVKIQKVILMKSCEPTTAEVFSQARGLAKSVMAMTARPVELMDTTRAQLKGVGIRFAMTTPAGESFETSVDGGTSAFRNGIYFLGAHKNKGHGLVAFLEKTKLAPKRIVFVDDKVRHVNAVNTSLAPFPLQHEEFRYGAVDEKVKAFRMDRADEEAKKYRNLIK